MGVGGDLLRGIPVVGGGLAGPELAPGYDTHHEERVKYARQLAEQRGKYDPTEYEQYLNAGGAPVNDAFSRAAQGAAQAYAARGLSGSPVASGAQSGLAGQRDQQMQAVQSRAADAARRALRQRTLDQYGAETGTWRQSNQASLDAAAARRAEDDAMWNAVMALGSEAISSQRQVDAERSSARRRFELASANGWVPPGMTFEEWYASGGAGSGHGH